MILKHLGGPKVIIKVLKVEQEGRKGQRDVVEVEVRTI